MAHRVRRATLLMLFMALAGGCAHEPYTMGPAFINPDNVSLHPGEPQIEAGNPHEFLDFAGSWLNPYSLLAKLILWDRRVQNHQVSDETVAVMQTYLDDNGLRDVKVRVNQYAPGDEWSRLFRNRAIGAGWRYTLGVLSVSFYTILPGRFFGGDSYNPFTHTISLYSDHRAIALHEGGHAKDFEDAERRGTYAAIGSLPLAPLYYEAQATGDAVGYMRARDLAEMEKEGYKILYPAYGTYVGGEFIGLVDIFSPVDTLVALGVQLAIVIPGHVVGRIKSALTEVPEPDTAPQQAALASPAEEGQ